MHKKEYSNLNIKIKLVVTYILTAFLICGLSTFVMQGVEVYHISYSAAGSLESYYQISKIVFAIGVIYITNKLGLKKGLILALCIIAVYCFFVPLLDSIWTIRFYLILAGVIFTFSKMFVYSYTSLATNDPQEHASFINLVEGVYMFSFSIGMLVYSLFMKLGNWLLIFYLFCGFALIVALIWYFTKIDESSLVDDKKNSSSIGPAKVKALLKLILFPSVIVFLIMMGMEESIEQGMGSWLPQFNNKILELPHYISIQMASILTFSFAIGRLFGSYILTKVSWKKLFSIYLVISILLLSAVLLCIEPGSGKDAASIFDAPITAYLLPLVGFFIGPILPTLCSVILTKLPLSKHALMMIVIIIFGALESAMASKVTGILFGNIGGVTSFALVTILPLFILLVLIGVFTLLEKKE